MLFIPTEVGTHLCREHLHTFYCEDKTSPAVCILEIEIYIN